MERNTKEDKNKLKERLGFCRERSQRGIVINGPFMELWGWLQSLSVAPLDQRCGKMAPGMVIVRRKYSTIPYQELRAMVKTKLLWKMEMSSCITLTQLNLTFYHFRVLICLIARYL